MAKRVRISADGGTTWYTLPGNTADISSKADSQDDTIFGQDYKSSQTGLIGWEVSANAIFKGYSGYVTKILKPGASTAMSGEATTLVSGKTYQITAATKRIINRNAALVINDNGGAVAAADILSIDYLFGKVTFTSGYTVTGPITIDGEYFPTVSIGCANEFTLTQTAEAIDNTCMDTAQANSGHKTYEPGLKTVSLELSGIYKTTNGFLASLIARSEVVIQIDLAGDGLTVARGFFKPMETGQSGDVGALEQNTISYELSVPDDDKLVTPFHWEVGAGSTLNTAIQECLDSWENSTVIDIAYLEDGTTGLQGNCIITDLSLAGGLTSMNTFTVKVQGSDQLVAYP